MNRAAQDNIAPTDPRYAELLRRGFNKRFESKPDYIRLVGSTTDVIDAIQTAVQHDLRVVVRSGGHCLEGFVADPAVRVIVDMLPMTGVSYDSDMKAFCIEAGTTLGEVYRKLFIGWGVVLPAGQSPDIGIGGHALGSAFGFLHRQHGLAGDHLYAVEVVVVDATGTVTSVVATREPSDPNRELWWAHTGGGGGNFGVVTRYWFRSHGTDGSDPAHALPKAPESVVTLKAEWSWRDVDEGAFSTLLRNFGRWCERNADAKVATSTVFSVLIAGVRQEEGTISLRGMSTAGRSAEQQLEMHLAAVSLGLSVAHTRTVDKMSWLSFALNPFPDLFFVGPGGTAVSQPRLKAKDALLRKRHTDEQIAKLYDHISRTTTVAGGIGLATYGGKVNAVAGDATAAAQRDAVMATSYSVGWQNPDDEKRSVAWVRDLYRDVFSETGGVPAPNASNDGALITHPDADLADSAWNSSGVPWYTMYYKDNYARLQRVKARWDPRNVFHHALSIRAPTLE
ncbi:MAG: FAD-binding oxidoreductase [Gemmatimonadota bacterium]|nr:FAD-binding oxidoreductase [Gemmatimonadota bacterium]